jgi:outer membrane protein OmpA-like peptidoglycan-associated protein
MKTVLFLSFFLLSLVPINAQEKSAADLKEYFYDAEFFFAQEEYADALFDYMELYNNGYKDNANINYRIGICYLNIPGQKDKSISYLLEAITNVSKRYNESTLKQKSAPFDTWLFLGNAYRVNNKLNDAIGAYNKYKELVGTVEEIKYTDQQIAACNTAIQFMETPQKLKFINLGDSVNGNSSDFKGVISGDGRTLLYMNELPFYDAIYYTAYTSHGWASPVNITPQIQSDGDQYVSSVSYDGSLLILTKEDAFNSDFYISRFENGKWSKSVPMVGQDLNTKFWESHASLSRDGKTLYFTSNRKDGQGDMDIYMSKQQSEGHWGQPVNLGPNVNTPLNEDTPFITDNDSLLFFSSQGHENMGGYDIFVSKLNSDGQWSVPQNLRYPVNTTDDDLFYYPWNNGRVGVTSRILDNGFGKEDIYAVQPYEDKQFDEVLAELVSKDQIAEKAPVADVVQTPMPVVPEPSDAITEPAKPVEPEKSAEPSAPVKPVAVAAPKEIQLEPVYFAFDNFELTAEGRKQLEKVYQLLKEYPEVRVRLIGHADAKGPAEYNLQLSKKRAITTLNYIKALGIEDSRLESTGMGEKNFAAINSNPDGTDNPEGRKLNRRVEYEIIGPNDRIMIIRMTPVPANLKFRE